MSDADPLAQALAEALTRLASTLSSQALRLDPALAAELERLEGRVLEIRCTQPPLTWQAHITGGAVDLRTGAAARPHTIVTGTALDLLRRLLGEATAQVEIVGDVTLLEELTSVLRTFSPQFASPDFARPLDALLGPELARTLVGTAEVGLKSLRSVVAGVGDSVRQQASHAYVGEQQFDELLTRVDELRLRVDRLAARIAERERARG